MDKIRNVKFKYLKMKNFNCHEEMEFDFYKNRLVFITGNNGKGKTTIIDALVFALYDQTTRGKKGPDVVRHRAGKNCSVILEFLVDNIEYRIESYVKDSKEGTQKKLFENGVEISASLKKGTTEFISQLIMPYKLFVNCILFSKYVNQSFMLLKQSGQKDILNTMLNLDKYDIYYEKISKKLSEYISDIEKFDLELNTRKEYLGNKQTDIEYLQNKLKQTEEENKNNIKLIKNNISNLKTNKKSIVFDISLVEQLIKNKEELVKSLAVLTEKMSTLIKLCKNEIESNSKELIHCQSLLDNKLDTELNEKRIRITEKESNIELEKEKLNTQLSGTNLQKQINKITKEELIPLENSIKDLDSQINNIQFLNKDSRSKVDLLNADIVKFKKVLENSLPICPTCKQEIKSDKIKNIESEINKFSIEVKELETAIKMNDKNKSILDAKIITFNKSGVDINSRIAKLEKEKEELEQKYNKELEVFNKKSVELIKERSILVELFKKQKEKELLKLKTEYEEKELSIKSKYRDLASDAENKLKQEKETLSNIDESLTKLNNIKEEINKIDTLISNCEKEIETSNKSFNSHKTIMESNIEKTKNEYNSMLDEINNKIKSVEIKKKHTDILKFWKDAFGSDGITSIILDESIPILNKKARELCQFLDNISISFDSQKTLKSGDQRNKFQIKALNTLHLSEFSEFSAGETQLVNIIVLFCLRDLLETMNNCRFNILLFDECLDSLDPANSQIVSDTLKRFANDYCVLLISHTLRESVDADEYLQL